MPLTPLHFGRRMIDGAVLVDYGSAFYITDCGRFYIQRDRTTWMVVGATPDWDDWCEHVGIKAMPMDTRQAILEALTAALSADCLMDTDTPS